MVILKEALEVIVTGVTVVTLLEKLFLYWTAEDLILEVLSSW